MHGYKRGAVFAALVGSVLTTGGVAGAAPSPDSVINVTQPSSGAFTMSQTTHRPGNVRFHFTSNKGLDSQGNGGMDIVLVKPTNGATIADVERHIAAQQGQNGAASTRWLVRHGQFFGGSGIEGKGTTDSVVDLPAGTLYALDANAVFADKDPTQAPKQEIRITGARYHSQSPRISSTISMTSADAFRVTSTHLGSGRYLVRNISDTLHFAIFAPVKRGTTDADITKAAKQEQNRQAPSPNPYLANKPGVNSDVISPGRSEIFDSALLTPGTYDLECYIADDRSGMPHFFMGMHKIVVIP